MPNSREIRISIFMHDLSFVWLIVFCLRISVLFPGNILFVFPSGSCKNNSAFCSVQLLATISANPRCNHNKNYILMSQHYWTNLLNTCWVYCSYETYSSYYKIFLLERGVFSAERALWMCSHLPVPCTLPAEFGRRAQLNFAKLYVADSHFFQWWDSFTL